MTSSWQITLPALLAWLSAIIAISVVWLIWPRRSIPGVNALSFLLLAVAIWSLFSGAEAAVIPLNAKILFSKCEYLGSTTAAPFFLLFALYYTRQTRWITPRNQALLWTIPFLSILLVWTNEWHHLIWTGFSPVPTSQGVVYAYHHGVAFFILVGYVYICNAIATWLLLRSYFNTAQIYRRQIQIIVIASLIPWIGSVFYALDLIPVPGLDVTPMFFAASSALLAWGIVNYHLFDLVPVARDLLIESLREGILVLDLRNRILDMNPSARRLLGLAATPAGTDIAQYRGRWPDLVATLLEQDVPGREVRLTQEADQYVELHAMAITGSKGQSVGRLFTLEDITERKRIEAKMEVQSRELERLVVTDDLTGLNNRRHANEVMRREFQRSERSRRPFAISLFDLDNLKRINDTYGHACGDAVLRAIAAEMKANFRASDLMARMGGDEFLVLFFDTEVDKAWHSLERLRLRLSALDMVEFGGETGHVTISGGVTGWLEGDTPDAALRRVDRLLYLAKTRGRNRIFKK